MKCAVTDYSRCIDWLAVKGNPEGDPTCKMRYQVTRFVRGINGQRAGKVSSQRILRWFSGTPRVFVLAAIERALAAGYIQTNPNANNVEHATFSVTPQGLVLLTAAAQSIAIKERITTELEAGNVVLHDFGFRGETK